MTTIGLDIPKGDPFGVEWDWSRHIIESVANGVSISDAIAPDLPLIYINPAFEKMTGYSKAEVLGKNCRFLQGSDTHQPALEGLREALRQGLEYKAVLKNYRKDGTLFWNELNLSPIRDREGRLVQFVGIQNDVTARVELDTKISYLAHHDMLTGLANRSELMDRLERAILVAKRSDGMLALLFFDLDNFKLVNDMFGHDAGDVLLKVVADRLRLDTRKYETAARLGGDEFVVILENIKTELEANAIMERLRHQISQPMIVAEQPFQPSASVGLALFPRDGATPRDLLRASDTAMYLAKYTQKQEALAIIVPGPVE